LEELDSYDEQVGENSPKFTHLVLQFISWRVFLPEMWVSEAQGKTSIQGNIAGWMAEIKNCCMIILEEKSPGVK
jgi:hypothetical protein